MPKSSTSPTQRSLKYLRDKGFIVQIVEHWNSFAGIRIDLFGIIDIIAIHPKLKGVVGIQTTSDTNLPARVKKALDNKILPIWMDTGNYFLVHGWGLKGAKGKRKTYQLRVKQLTRKDFD